MAWHSPSMNTGNRRAAEDVVVLKDGAEMFVTRVACEQQGIKLRQPLPDRAGCRPILGGNGTSERAEVSQHSEIRFMAIQLVERPRRDVKQIRHAAVVGPETQGDLTQQPDVGVP